MSRGQKKIYRGRVKRNPDGFGFFISESEEIEDIYIPKEEMRGVFTNDIVKITVDRKSGRFGTRGKVKEIVERSSLRCVGRLNFNESNGTYFLKDSAHGWGQTLNVQNPESYPEGDLVLVEISSYPELGETEGFDSEVISSLGSSVDPNTDNIRILHESKVPIEFSKKALKEAKSLGDVVREKDKKNRKDLRDTCLITIDGVTAKDFDDAIYVKKNKNGTFKLIVAIADVSFYINKDSTLDNEAYQKGTSVYLSNFVCPMLPESISNGLCSLNPNVDRLAFCCDMTISNTGEVKNYEFYEALIKSHARVTYGEAQEFIETQKSEFSDSVKLNIMDAQDLALVLNEARMESGSIDFDLPAVKVLVDDSGEATDLVKEDRIFAHRLIEELMLITNICASKFIEKHKQEQLYRIHEPPDNENLAKLESLLGQFLGGKIGKIKSSFDFQRLNKKLEDLTTPILKTIVQGMTLRSLKQAQYSSNNQGHFGLGFTHYAHFTSPIRRYPDLVIHRQIKSILKVSSKKDEPYAADEMSSMGAILSAAEQRAVKAERKVTSIKKARFFERFVGHEFSGYISSMAKFGLFVTLREYPLDGLVKVDDLSGDYFIFDEDTLTLKGKRSKKIFRVGDKVTVRVASVSVEDGKIDFELLSHKEQNIPKGSSADRPPSRGSKSDKNPYKKSGKGKNSKTSKSNKKSSKKTDKKTKSKKKFNKRSSEISDEQENKKSYKKKSFDKDDERSSKSSNKEKKPNLKKASSLFSSSFNARGLSFSKNKKKK